ncbi:hypothetical protein [Coxiella endosymbiont of Rhipicephalus microplus]|uniref:hypothetical protein n=1 Tax=Coxiella endosymbiont of Rhipicephalus microplus TaxID=1656186 RepID=UPI000CC7A27D|nr:hypothetical protein [Coxiella endosymbiont of Rhipicephalus microplus]PMB54906.1 hypothetical protein CLERM_679 [Coxiella-like endosymbiont]
MDQLLVLSIIQECLGLLIRGLLLAACTVSTFLTAEILWFYVRATDQLECWNA